MEVSQVIFSLNSEEPSRLRAFYRDTVGLKPNPEMGEEALMAANTAFLVDGHSELSGSAKEPARTMANFAVDDLVAETARLEAAGVEFVSRRGGPEDEEIAFCTFVDPDGNYGQIFQMGGAPAGSEFFAVMVGSEDAERLKTFYRNVVGISDDFPEMGSPFMAGGTPIYIGEHSELHGQAKEPPRVMLNFFVDDLAAEQKRIEGHGVKFIRTAGREFWGGVISTFPDPDGNYLQIIEFRPE